MKKVHLIAIAVIAVAIGLLISLTGDVGTFSSFKDASVSGDRVKIVGQLSKDKEIYYEPTKDPDYFTFFLKDTNGEEKKVVLLSGKPQEFERSEQIVLTGQMKGEEFVATDMLLKCPSKYKDEEIYIKSKENTI